MYVTETVTETKEVKVTFPEGMDRNMLCFNYWEQNNHCTHIKCKTCALSINNFDKAIEIFNSL